jgi:hypothetical protein
MKTDDLLAGLPGETLVRKGLADLKLGQCTTAACLAAIARNRLIAAGVIAEEETPTFPEPELQLYQLLRREGGDAYSRYNSLVRELVSFEMALDRRNRIASEIESRTP